MGLLSTISDDTRVDTSHTNADSTSLLDSESSTISPHRLFAITEMVSMVLECLVYDNDIYVAKRTCRKWWDIISQNPTLEERDACARHLCRKYPSSGPLRHRSGYALKAALDADLKAFHEEEELRLPIERPAKPEPPLVHRGRPGAGRLVEVEEERQD
ncbi:MAG: hypothetical protein Q9165_001041 [Trypethelium subeluteriae]